MVSERKSESRSAEGEKVRGRRAERNGKKRGVRGSGSRKQKGKEEVGSGRGKHKGEAEVERESRGKGGRAEVQGGGIKNGET